MLWLLTRSLLWLRLRDLRELERADVRDDRPAIRERDLRGVRRHRADAVRNRREELPVGHLADLFVVKARHLRERSGPLRHHPLPVARLRVARRAVDVEALLPARDHLLEAARAIDRAGRDGEDVTAVLAARRERLV